MAEVQPFDLRQCCIMRLAWQALAQDVYAMFCIPSRRALPVPGEIWRSHGWALIWLVYTHATGGLMLKLNSKGAAANRPAGSWREGSH